MAQLSSEEVVKYSHSPVHSAVARHDYASLRRIISTLPRLAKVGEILGEVDSIAEEQRADDLSTVIDRRDVPGKETALHLAVRLGDTIAVEMLMAAGADWSLQNERGWSALQEAVCAREEAVAMLIMRYYHPMAWTKWCRRLPRIIATMHRMRDFFMELEFHLESSVIPFMGRIVPSYTYRIWKRGSNLRADMTLPGFDGFRIQRLDHSILFLGEGSADGKLAPGYLCLLRHKDKEAINALEGADSQPSETEIAREVAAMFQTNIYRPGIDVTQAELMPQLTWRGQQKSEMVGVWKAKIYDMHHVMVSIKSRKVTGASTGDDFFGTEEVNRKDGYLDEDFTELLTEEEKHQLESALTMDRTEMDEEYFATGNFQPANGEEPRLSSASWLVKNGDTELNFSSKEEKKGSFISSKQGFKLESRKKMTPSRNSLCSEEKVSDLLGESPNQAGRKGLKLERGRRSVGSRHSDFRVDDRFPCRKENDGRKSASKEGNWKQRGNPSNVGNGESEYKKGLRPVLSLTESFPLKTEELLPLLDILSTKVKAVRRLRELLTMKLPTGTFPVKVAIPVVPTFRVVVTFTKFEELMSTEEFATPRTSAERSKYGGLSQQSSNSWFSWIKGSASKVSWMPGSSEQPKDITDLFVIPSDYVRTSMNAKKCSAKDKNSKGRNGKKFTPVGLGKENER